MSNKEFDDIIKRALEDYQPKYDPASWDVLSDRLPGTDENFDKSVRDAVSMFSGGPADDWDVMEQMIESSDDLHFDEEVKQEINTYNEPYDPTTWPKLDRKIDEFEKLRRRLIISKILEVAAILLALVTFYNFWPELHSALNKDKVVIADRDVTTGPENTSTNAFGVLPELSAENERAANRGSESLNALEDENIGVDSSPNATDHATGLSIPASSRPQIKSRTKYVFPALSTGIGGGNAAVLIPALSGSQKAIVESAVIAQSPAQSSFTSRDVYSPSFIGSSSPMMVTSQGPALVAMVTPNTNRKGIRIGLGASFDVNSLYIPSQQFYADGDPIYFEQKHLLAAGYSAGASVLIDSRIFSFETGLYYSLKKYEPNRIIKIGKTFDVSTIDFKEISLQSVHIPALVHWNFDRRGKTRFYMVGGASLNCVVTAHYDLYVESELRSAPAGSRPPDPLERDIQQVREHLLDGADFSSKSFITVTGGFGVDHRINKKFSVFFEPTYNHQVPFFDLTDLNGKRLRYLSMNFGTRVTIR